MKVCPNPSCKTENPDRANYCLHCGAGFHVHQAGSDGGRFCVECGRPLNRFRSDRRLVTVLFADVHGFTAMSEKLEDPELVTEIMNQCFGMLTTKIVELGGSIDKYVGDQIMAVFGAPDAHEDDPERAVRAALAMQKELVVFNSLMLTQRGLNLGLEMRIGLNTGLVTAGDVGGEVEVAVTDELGRPRKLYRDYRAYTVMGPTVNLASRMEHAARVGYILVTDSTYEATRHAFEFVQQPPRQVKGVTGLVSTWEALSPKAQRETRRGLAGYDLQLIGREDELATLWHALQAILPGNGQIVSIVGEAGSGKTSLLREFRRRLNAAHPNVLYLYGSCFSYSSTQPYSLMSNTIRQLCDINDDDDDATLRQKFINTVARLMDENPLQPDGNYSELAALIGLALGLNLPNRLIDNLEPALRSRLATDAISDFLLNKAEAEPLVLVLDDLHWIDSSSLDVLDRIVQKVMAGNKERRILSVLLLLVHRPDFNHHWPLDYFLHDQCYRTIEPGRLTDEQLGTLARQLLGKLAAIEYAPGEILSPLPSALVSELARADGNPFFAEEILKALWDSHQLYFVQADPELDKSGGWKAAGDARKFQLPETLQEILLTRIDSLPGASKHVLQVGSVIGQHFEHRLLLSVEDLRERTAQVDTALDELHQEGFVYTEQPPPDPTYAFRQALTQEVAYQNLLAAERKIYHEQIAAAIERIYSSHLEDYDILNALARHYQNTDNHQKAILYLTRAGHSLKNIYQNEVALRNYYEARARLNLLPVSAQDLKRAYTVEINRSIGEILTLRAEYNPALETYRAALQTCDEPADRVDLWSRIIEVQTRLGDFEGAEAVKQQAQAEYVNYPEVIRREPHFVQMHARLLARSGWAAYQQSKYDEAIDVFITALALLENLPDQTREVQVDAGTVYGNLGSVYLDVGRIEQATDCFQKAIVIQEKASNLAKVARAYINISFIYVIQGEWRKAEQYFKLARSNAERVGDVEAVATSVGNLGQIYEREGRLNAANRSYAEANRSFGLSSNQLQQTVAQLNSGYILVQQGKTAQALALFESAIHIATHLNAGWLVAYGYTYLGLTYTASEHLLEARNWLEKGYQQAQVSGNSEALAISCLYLAEFLLEYEPDETIAVYLDEATPLIQQIGDPVLRGRLARLQGRLAFQQQNFEQAIAYFQSSLDILENFKAYLEMSYTKFYLAHALLERVEQSESAVECSTVTSEGQPLICTVETIGSPPTDDYERGQVLLQQAVETFRACEANLMLPKASALLEKYAPSQAA